MIQVQKQISNCIDQIIQHNSMLQNVFEEIYQQGGRVLLVGGVVRDCLLDRLAKKADLDFEVYYLSFGQLEEILKQFRPVSLVGKSFGVLRMHGLDADWSIPRKDSSGRKPMVELDPDMSFEQACKRRDLTVNAMGIDVHVRELIDPYDGLQDLQHKVLRAPDIEFFVQDPLRLFRVMQFAARLEMRPDEQLQQVCMTMDIADVSSERIEDEFKKLFLKAQKPSIGFVWLQQIGRLQELFEGVVFDSSFFTALDCVAKLKDVSDFEKLSALWGCLVFAHSNTVVNEVHINQLVSKEQLRVLKAFIKKHVAAVKLQDCSVKIGYYIRYIPELTKQQSLVGVKWLAHWLPENITLHFLNSVASCWYGQEVAQAFAELAQQAGVLNGPEKAVLTGKDLLQYAQGAELGKLVKQAYEIQLNQNITDTKKLIEILLHGNNR